MKIENLDERVEMAKRMYAPIIVSSDCPTCGETKVIDHTEGNYFGYPLTNEPFELGFWCNECEGDDWSHTVVLRVRLEKA